ncbi:MAG: PucR family transcriptional regulator [Actinomycetota bacterium]|nr:MAG: PucR family transcriptional regulator [Actinomycetota bacterium]
MDDELPWFRQLPAEARSWVGLIAQAGIAGFVEWFRHPQQPQQITADVFGTAPRELVRAISLQQTVEMVRATIAVIEERVDELAAPGREGELREAILRYSREIAFAAAEVYAQAAEARGAWDARLESLVIDALVRDEVDDGVVSRAAALGWPSAGAVAVAVGRCPTGDPETAVDAARRLAAHHGFEVLTGVHGDVLVVVVGSAADLTAAVRHLLPAFERGPVVVGQARSGSDGLVAAGQAAAEALAALRVADAWPECPRVVDSAELLPERVVAGDARARAALRAQVLDALASDDRVLLDTLAALLERAGTLEAAARLLYVHPNTVRYRLRRVAELTGLHPSDPRGALILRLALMLQRLPADAVTRSSEPRDAGRASGGAARDDAAAL